MSWLQEVRVLEMGDGVAVAYAGHLLAGLGAEVWKIEPPNGDPMRRQAPFPGDRADPEASAAFLFYNSGKRSVCIGPDRRGDAALLRRLAAGADIVIADAAAARLLKARALSRRGAIVVAVTPFGLTGPYRSFGATDLTLQAIMGLMFITGEPGRAPLKVGLPIPELVTGQLAALVAMASLWQRGSVGPGMLVDLSIWECALTAMEHAPMNWSYRRALWRRRGNLGGIAGWGLYPCKDGHVGVISGLGETYDEFRRMIGPPLDDPKFASMAARTRFADEMHAAILSWLSPRGRRSVVREAQRRRLPFGYLHSVADLLESPQFKARRFFRRIPHPHAGSLPYPAGPFRSSSAEWRVDRAPLLDEHRQAAASVEPRRGTDDRPAGPEASARLPLAGVRILEMAVVWAGPLCARMLADLGAEVIKLETARRPDFMRGSARPQHPAEGCYPGGKPGHDPWNRHAYFNDRSRNKWGVCVDLDVQEGRTLARDIASRCDVVIENFTPGALTPLGLDYNSISAVRPDIIYLSMPSAGLTGPERDQVGYGATNDLTSGLVSVTGYEDGVPQNVGINASDPIAAFHGALSVVAALHQRRRTGQGQWIDLSQRESTAHLMGPLILGHGMNGRSAEPSGNTHPALVPHDVYPCRGEDSWIAIAIDREEAWHSLCRLAGRRLRAVSSATREERLLRQEDLNARIGAWTATQDRDELWRRLQAAGVASAPVYEADHLMRDPHLRSRSFWSAVVHPSAGRRLYPGTPWRIGGGRTAQRPAPTLGEHNRIVCQRLLGLAATQMDRLEAAGVLVTRPR